MEAPALDRREKAKVHTKSARVRQNYDKFINYAISDKLRGLRKGSECPRLESF